MPLGRTTRTLRTGQVQVLKTRPPRFFCLFLPLPLHPRSCHCHPFPRLLLTSLLSCSQPLCLSFLLSPHFSIPSFLILFLLPPPLFYISSSCQILNSGQKVSSKPLFFPEFAKSSQALSLFPSSLPVIRTSPFLARDAYLEGGSSGGMIPGPQVVNLTMEMPGSHSRPMAGVGGTIWERKEVSWSSSNTQSSRRWG